MRQTRQVLTEYLALRPGLKKGLASVVEATASACAEISRLIAAGALRSVLGAAASSNVQGEAQKKLDIISNEIIKVWAARSGSIRGLASEEEDNIVSLGDGPNLDFLLMFDPLDGSSNIDVNVSIGTIFSVLDAPAQGQGLTSNDFLQTGRCQLAAGYAIYGPQTNLVITLDEGVAQFTLDPDNQDWVLTQENLRIPDKTQEFSVNMSNIRHWRPAFRTYIEVCLAGRAGPRGKDFNMRWTASMVADVNRVLCRGGIFLYPWDAREPARAGKLRLMYEANPMSLIVERAGGASWNGVTSILDVEPLSIHQRVQVILGSRSEVECVAHYSNDASLW